MGSYLQKILMKRKSVLIINKNNSTKQKLKNHMQLFFYKMKFVLFGFNKYSFKLVISEELTKICVAAVKCSKVSVAK